MPGLFRDLLRAMTPPAWDATAITVSDGMNAPQTLQEFINLTKGIEYIIAVLFLLLFVLFWRLLNKRNDS